MSKNSRRRMVVIHRLKDDNKKLRKALRHAEAYRPLPECQLISCYTGQSFYCEAPEDMLQIGIRIPDVRINAMYHSSTSEFVAEIALRALEELHAKQRHILQREINGVFLS